MTTVKHNLYIPTLAYGITVITRDFDSRNPSSILGGLTKVIRMGQTLEKYPRNNRDVEESGLSRYIWDVEYDGSNPSIPTN